MARRRTIEAPTRERLAEIGAAVAPRAVPPIAQVAADATQHHGLSRDAAAWREASAAGRVIVEIPLGAIDCGHVTRDRIAADPEEMEELAASIRASGVRLPIEVVPIEGGRYGLISGHRRVEAVRMLHERGQGPALVRAIVAEGRDAAAAYVAMVEENEVRADLTPYERGRIAVVAAAEGAFADPDAAVDAIYAAASKAKRSKIRSFAAVHAALGDALAFPQALSEKGGLRLARAIRGGAEPGLRGALARPAADAAAEWRALEAVLDRVEAGPPAGRVAGRPRRGPALRLDLGGGVTLSRSEDARGHVIRLQGPADAATVDAVLTEVAERLRRR